jgi:hypothetical protein
MAIKLNQAAVERAKYIIKAGEVESFDESWSEVQPTPTEVDHFLATHYMREYGEWFLGKNSDIADTNKEHYVYPYGDLKEVQRSALLDTIAKAEKKGDSEIVRAAKELLELVDEKGR